jgi:hypothetical protein
LSADSERNQHGTKSTQRFVHIEQLYGGEFFKSPQQRPVSGVDASSVFPGVRNSPTFLRPVMPSLTGQF